MRTKPRNVLLTPAGPQTLKADDRQYDSNMTTRVAVAALRWVARIWSVASVGLLCAFLVGEGLPPLTAMVMLFPFCVMLGLVLAWWFERVGGLIAAVSILLFYALHFINYGGLPGGYVFLLFSAPSVIFICCGHLRARERKSTTA